MKAKIGVALGGGGARGLAHVGVLKALEEEKIPIHCITGTSMGAIVGAMYAQNPDAESLMAKLRKLFNERFYEQLGMDYLKTSCAQDGSFLRQITQDIKKRIVINLAQSRDALLKNMRLKQVLSGFIPEGKIEDTRIPLAIIATSLHTGEDIVFRSGALLDAIVPSSSVPCFLSPTIFGNDLLTDGAVSCPVPVKVLKDLGANVTVGVEVCMRIYNPLEVINIIEILDRANMITSRNLSEMMVGLADVAICPDTKNISWSEFSRMDELFAAGYDSAMEKIPQIKRAIHHRLSWYQKIKLLLGRKPDRTPSIDTRAAA